MRISVSDLATAAAPVVGGLTLSTINQVASLVGTLTGFAYLVWKWRRDARTPPRS